MRRKSESPAELMETARSYFASLCARSEQCAADLRTKMLRRGLSPQQAAELLEWLENERFIDAERFCRAFVHDKMAFARWGRRKIGAALFEKRLPEAAIRQALADIDEDEYGRCALAVAQSRSRGLDLAQAADRARLFRSMQQRGFESELISRAIKILRASDYDD